MAEETKKTATETAAAAEEVAVCDVPVAEEPAKPVVEKEKDEEAPPQPEKVEEPAVAEEVAEAEKEKESEENKITESASFKEESNKVDDLIDPEKKALDDLKHLIQEALNQGRIQGGAWVGFSPPQIRKLSFLVVGWWKLLCDSPRRRQVEEEEAGKGK